ncbi:Uu.00g110750.m01.CDS01 [Anthostomella pinea]|uniref:Uu.00g110750.m01.CDS01 n=1 Tax=Anthostomella pinea TaxID=933095 RepID=A0AAI8V9T6_9PEZI|nr:Uu.00g110750.m01.CDS01 [Anthostomella pinea]
MISFDAAGTLTLGRPLDCIATNTLHTLASIMQSSAYATSLVPIRQHLWFFDS